MSVEAITWALKQEIESSSAKFVLVVLANCADGSTFDCHPSIAYICKSTSQNRKTVITNIQRLSESGHIADTGRRVGATGGVKVYRLEVKAVPKTEPLREDYGVPKTGPLEAEEVPKTVPLDSETVPFLDGSSPKNGTQIRQETTKDKRSKNVADSDESSDEQNPPKWTKDDRDVAETILRGVREAAPSAKGTKKWPDEVRLMRERDGRTHQEIVEMFTWANGDTFWRANILSPAKLREKWPQLEAKRNSLARAGPVGSGSKAVKREQFWRQMNDGRTGTTERVIDGKAERVD